MLSILITTKDPEKTFKKSFEALLRSATYFQNQVKETAEIVIASPCKYEFLSGYTNLNIQLVLVEDEKKGKPAALNKAVLETKGEYIVCSDGDVLLDEKAIYSVYTYVKTNNLVIAGGKPQSTNTKKSMLGYWSWVLAEGNAHRIRKGIEEQRQNGKNTFFPVSGYLFIIKKANFPRVKTDVLVDDAYISYQVFKEGFGIGYDENALVYIKYPDTYRDYVIQKTRSTGGYIQNEVKQSKIRSFKYEALNGIIASIQYGKTLKEKYWSILLILSRIHIWFLINYHIKLRGNSNIWKVVESSKNI